MSAHPAVMVRLGSKYKEQGNVNTVFRFDFSFFFQYR